MVECSKCHNETRTAALMTPMGEVTVSGPANTEPLRISAQVCVACGHIDLYAPQRFEQPEQQGQRNPVMATLEEVLSGEKKPVVE